MANVTKTKRSSKPVSIEATDDGSHDRSLSSRRSNDYQSISSVEKPSRHRHKHGILLGCMVTLAQGSLIFMGAILTYSVVNFSKQVKFLSSDKWSGESPDSKAVKLHIPSGLDHTSRRSLSLDLGGGNCKWQPPVYDVPTTVDFYKTLIAGFPSGDKRMIFVQMEALTGWPAKDEWDFEFLGNSNHPFIKANYPQHEGIWGWGTNADQVVMMVRNIRKSMVEYHDILWDIGYAKTWEEATLNLHKLYGERPPLEDFLEWRDLRVMDEVHWYGWFIDYWMEGGLMRDMFTHKITTPEHWNMLMMPTKYTKAELDYDVVVGPDAVVTPSYDPHCENGDISGGCEPVAVISAEDLRDYSRGPLETARIANVLMNSPKMSPYVIDSKAWNCIWTELIPKGKGLKVVTDRIGGESNYNFSAEMLQEMVTELDRLISKYSSIEWNTRATANRIVELITEHRGLVQAELNEVNSGRRKLSANDMLGPKERQRRRLLARKTSVKAPSAPNLKYFDAMEKERMELKRRKVKQAQMQRKAQRKEERIAERKALRKGGK